MFAYKADVDFNLSSSKASVVFKKEPHTPRNQAEVEMLEDAYKAWKIWRVEIKVEETKKEEKEVENELKDVQSMYEEKIGKLPPNKKNDIERLKEKLLSA